MKLRLLFSLIFGAFLTAGFSQSIGIIGNATPTGWDSDTDMTQNVDSSHLWSVDIQLTAGGAAKFRQDDAWTINWGGSDFPVGIGEQNGADIPVSVSGLYTVTLNTQTGAYLFSLPSAIGIIGSATPGGWNYDTNMFQDALDTNEYHITLRLVAGAAKFRANDGWDVNWGSTSFPSGIGTQGGMDIPIAIPGNYDITFNKATGAYSFEEIVEFTRVGLVGSATPGGWDVDTYLTRDNGNPDIWRTDVALTDGVAKFRADSAWTLNWGGTDFPVGVATEGGGDIPVDSGEYRVTFNTATLAYEFLPIVSYATIGIIGDATPNGWDGPDSDMTQDPNDASIWRLRIVLTDGELQFRANNAWDMFWSSGEFPTGVGVFEGAPIPIEAGEYKITFNSITGAYSFEELVIFGTVGMIGTVFPVTEWTEDVDMIKDLDDEAVWYLNSVELATGEAKFRAENAWAVNWGNPAFPTGIGTQDGMNIIVPGGTYRVVINTGTGEYSFGAPSSTTNLLDGNSISITPNPAKDVLNITVTAQEMKGDVQVTLFNQKGQKVLSSNLNIQDRATLQVGSVQPGVYTLHMTNGKSIVGKQVVIVK